MDTFRHCRICGKNISGRAWRERDPANQVDLCKKHLAMDVAVNHIPVEVAVYA